MLGISLRNLLPVGNNGSVIVDKDVRCAGNGVTTHKGVGSWEQLGKWFALAERQCTDVFS